MVAVTVATVLAFNTVVPVYASLQTNNGTQAVSGQQEESRNYTLADLRRLSYYDLVDLLVKTDLYSLEGLFDYSEDARQFYGDKTRMSFLMDEIQRRGSQYTEIDSKGIPTLMEVVRAGFYQGFYNKELEDLNKREFRERAIPAILSVQRNANFKLGAEVQDKIVSSTGLLVWNGASNSETQWYRRIDGFINEVKNIALIGEVNEKNSWVIDNGIYHIASLGKLHSNPKIGIETLTQTMKMYPYLSQQNLQSAEQIRRNYNGIDASGNKIDIEKLKEEGKAKYCPKTYTFDNGKVIIKAGDRVEEEKIKRLYWASKEVNSQFFRVMGRDNPLEEGNPDEKLTMVIYNSPDEYSLNSILYGYDTNNGGMYIEGDGTFFTYERTPEESTYTLEELFRHEYTHYLQGRYAVPGQWGATELYKNDRLTWYEEGGAELLRVLQELQEYYQERAL